MRYRIEFSNNDIEKIVKEYFIKKFPNLQFDCISLPQYSTKCVEFVDQEPESESESGSEPDITRGRLVDEDGVVIPEEDDIPF